MAAACLTTFLWALSAVFAVRSSRLLGGTEANFWRLTIALVVLGAWAAWRGEVIANASWHWFAWSGLLGIGLGDTAMFQALPRLGSRLTVLLVACVTPPLAAGLEWALLDTRLTVEAIFFGLLALTGVGVALAPRGSNGARDHRAVGIAWALTSALAGAVGAVVNRQAFAAAAAQGMVPDGATAAFLRVLGGYGIALVAWQLAARVPKAQRTAASEPRLNRLQKWRAIPWVLGNAIFGLILGVSFYQEALSELPAGVVLAVTSLTPLTVIPLAWWLEGDRPTIRSLWGTITAVLGVIGLVWTW
ncbi:MAG: DMT family transporter [Verrucomicrobiota bacterium]|nr:DMT family transporter [Limisphaera sp.]MDW8380929.1 DMT family transporter [Verrucomicrobiota bacterium]